MISDKRFANMINRRSHLPDATLPLATLCAILLMTCSNSSHADDSTAKVREGMRQYSAEQFDEASKSFAAATESLEKAKSDKYAVAAFDEACALHRKGDLELARERYLKAGLSQDKSIATKAHFNIGLISSENARKLAGESPESVPADKRQEILGELSKSIDSYRHCLELEPKHAPARRNLELLRQWIKYYTDRWRAVDLEKRRREANLIQFLEYITKAQLAIKETVDGQQPNTSPNAFAELKRVQDELADEIPYLKDKIESELRPPVDDKNNANGATSSPSMTAKDKEEMERGIALLNGWADEAAQKMETAGKDLMKRQPKLASEQQKAAADKLEQIWDAVVPFHPLLAKELADQTQIAKQLNPLQEIRTADESPAIENADDEATIKATGPDPQLKVNDNDFEQLLEQQERTLRKSRLLGPKAESELEQVKNQPVPEGPAPEGTSTEATNATKPASEGEGGGSKSSPKVDPEAIEAGYQKAIELAPKAVEEMESAVKQLRKRERAKAASHAEEARRILQEIQDAQPKNPEQDKQDQKDENKDQNQDQKEDGDQKQDQNKENKEDQKKPDDKKEPDSKEPDKKESDKKESDKDKKDKEEKRDVKDPKVSKDRIEEAMRLVRERQQEKRERDKEQKARVIGRVPVDKDW